MSRTYRRKDLKGDISFVGKEFRRLVGSYGYARVPLEGLELLEALAKYHSDAYENFKEPGPAFWRNLTVERPQRRDSKNQLRKFMLDSEFVVILNSQDPLKYWT